MQLVPVGVAPVESAAQADDLGRWILHNVPVVSTLVSPHRLSSHVLSMLLSGRFSTLQIDVPLPLVGSSWFFSSWTLSMFRCFSDLNTDFSSVILTDLVLITASPVCCCATSRTGVRVAFRLTGLRFSLGMNCMGEDYS